MQISATINTNSNKGVIFVKSDKSTTEFATWKPGAKVLFIKSGKLAFEIDGVG